MLKEHNYIQGTAARKLEYDVYEENKVLSRKKKQRKNNKAKVKVVLCALIIFATGCLAMYRSAKITETNYLIHKQSKVYDDIRDENIRLKVAIENDINIQGIKLYVENELGMHNPDDHQITYVKIPQRDITIVSDAARIEEKKNSNVVSNILNKVGLMIGVLY